ncbi:DNA repair protein RecN [Gammaproteobacteria bacterium]|nr:DNA repair protein RecN [Gammaproteobacteria bacterium]
MLNSIFIKNFILVEQTELEIHAGFTAITGESGAGKSIIIDALTILLGERASSNLLKDNTYNGQIVATFNVAVLPKVVSWLQEHDYGEDHTCLIKRIISPKSASKCYINGVPASVAELKILGAMLVNIHGQHAHQALLQNANHIHLFDKFIGSQDLSKKTFQAFKRWQNLLKQQQQAEEFKATTQAQLDELTLQQEDIAELNLQEGELEELEAELKRLEQAVDILQAINKIEYTTTGDDLANTEQHLNTVIALANTIDDVDEDLTASREYFKTSLYNLQEATSSLVSYKHKVEHNPQRQEEVEVRLNDIYSLSRKYNLNANEILDNQHSLEKHINELATSLEQASSLHQQVRESEENYLEVAKALSNKRHENKHKLDKVVNKCLQDLGMQDCKMLTEFNTPKSTHTACGLEEVIFTISTNNSTSYNLLSKIASGGELSRINLAIQVAVADVANLPVLIFDEVDTGIGGNTAQVVGHLLRQLGNKAQVICITHQAQVAAYAQSHLLATKQNATTKLLYLEDNPKVDEIMRMLSGNTSASSRMHAQELLDNLSSN